MSSWNNISVKEFKPGKQPADDWEEWRHRYALYECLIEPEDAKPTFDIARRRAILLYHIGDEGLRIYNHLGLDKKEDDKLTVEIILDAFSEHYKSCRNITFNRYLFNTRSQNPGETFSQFEMDLYRLAHSCDFANRTADMIRDRILCGIRDPQVRTEILMEENLTLQSAKEICLRFESASECARFIKENRRSNRR